MLHGGFFDELMLCFLFIHFSILTNERQFDVRL